MLFSTANIINKPNDKKNHVLNREKFPLESW